MGVTYKDAIQKYSNLSPVGQASFGNALTGGQLGLGHNLRRIDAATPLVLPNAIPVVIHIPSMFEGIENMGNIVKALVERHTKSIDGINYTPTLETTEAMPLKDGQNVEMAVRATVGNITPTMVFPELQGNIVWETMRRWQGMMIDANTQFSNLSSFTGFGNDGEYAAYVMSTYSMAVLMIQPDITLLPQNIIAAALVINMFPKEFGEQPFKKDVTAGAEAPERSVSFSGIIINNAATRMLGMSVAESLGFHQANYDYAPAPVDEDYQNTIDLDAGHKELYQDILDNFVDPTA